MAGADSFCCFISSFEKNRIYDVQVINIRYSIYRLLVTVHFAPTLILNPLAYKPFWEMATAYSFQHIITCSLIAVKTILFQCNQKKRGGVGDSNFIPN
jgi:hypothetical protein